MGRKRIKPPKHELLPITAELLELIEGFSFSQRQMLFAEAGVSYSSWVPWKNGQYHPGLVAIVSLLKVLDKELIIGDRVPEA